MSGVADIVELEEERSRRAPLTDKSFETAGEMLRAVREANSISLEQASTATNVREVHLENIELMRIDALPAPAYTIGFVKAYGAFLELPVEPLVGKFKEQAGYPIEQIIPDVQSRPSNDLSGGRELSLLAVIGVVFFIIWCAFQITRPARETETLPSQISKYPLQQRAATEAERIAAEDDLFLANPRPTTQSSIEEAVTVPAIDVKAVDTTTPVSVTPAVEETEAQVTPEAASSDNALSSAPTDRPEDVGQSPSQVEQDPATLSGLPDEPNTADANIPANATVPEIVSPVAAPVVEMQAPAQLEQDLNEIALESSQEPPVNAPATPQSELVAGAATEFDDDFIEAIALERISPKMPTRCRIRGGEETVTVAFDISTTGQVLNPRIANSTNNCFDAAALRAIAGWTFNPAIQGNDPVVSTGRTTLFRFRN